jgi:hypothetical protein
LSPSLFLASRAYRPANIDLEGIFRGKNRVTPESTTAHARHAGLLGSF